MLDEAVGSVTVQDEPDLLLIDHTSLAPTEKLAVCVTGAATGCLALKVLQSVLLSAPRFVADAVGTFSVITGVVVPFATVELRSVPVVPRVRAATDVTVPLPVPAPIAARKVAASKVLTVLSALIRGKVMALGLVSVKKLLPTVVAPKLVLAPDCVDAPVPPRLTASWPVQPAVIDAAFNNAVDALPPNVKVTLVSLTLVSAAGAVQTGAAVPALRNQLPVLPAVLRANADAVE